MFQASRLLVRRVSVPAFKSVVPMQTVPKSMVFLPWVPVLDVAASILKMFLRLLSLLLK